MELVTGSQIYWLTRCDWIRGILGWSEGWVILFIVLLIISGIFYAIQTFGGNSCSIDVFGGYSDAEMAETKRSMRKTAYFTGGSALLILICCTFGELAAAFIPTTKEMAAIVVVPRVANSQSVQDLGSGIVNLAKEWMAELHPDKLMENRVKVEEKTAAPQVKCVLRKKDGRVITTYRDDNEANL